MAKDDDPPCPYKVYEGDELKGTYATRAEARRAQQRLAAVRAGAQLRYQGPSGRCRFRHPEGRGGAERPWSAG